PVVFITGHGDIPMTVHAMRAGAVDFLPKPFRDRDLLAAVRRAITRHACARKERAEVAEVRRRAAALSPRGRQGGDSSWAGGSTSRWASSWGWRRRPSRSTAPTSCKRWEPSRWRSWYAWRSGSSPTPLRRNRQESLRACDFPARLELPYD